MSSKFKPSELLKRIPREPQTTLYKNGRCAEVAYMLEHFTYTQDELKLIAEEIEILRVNVDKKEEAICEENQFDLWSARMASGAEEFVG